MKTGKPITGLYNKINIDYSKQADTEREYPPFAVPFTLLEFLDSEKYCVLGLFRGHFALF